MVKVIIIYKNIHQWLCISTSIYSPKLWSSLFVRQLMDKHHSLKQFYNVHQLILLTCTCTVEPPVSVRHPWDLVLVSAYGRCQLMGG